MTPEEQLATLEAACQSKSLLTYLLVALLFAGIWALFIKVRVRLLKNRATTAQTPAVPNKASGPLPEETPIWYPIGGWIQSWNWTCPWLEIGSPLLCGILVFTLYLLAVTVSSFYGADLNGLSLVFLHTANDASKDMPAEQGARGLWASALATLALAELFAVWTFTGVYMECERRLRAQFIAMASLVAVAVLLILGAWRSLMGVSAFGSKLVDHLVCFTAERSHRLYSIILVTDGLNLLGVLIPWLMSVTFCLALLAAHPERESPKRPSLDLQLLAQSQRMLDRTLYASAAVLVAGVVEVVALLSWSYAPYQGSTELKVHTDVCRNPPPTSALADWPFCKEASKIAANASEVDSARKFTRTLAMTFEFFF